MLHALLSLAVLGASPAVPLAPPPPVVVAPPTDALTSSAAAATLALEHEGRVDGAVLISEVGLALTTFQALPHPNASLVAALHDGRRVRAHVVALDPTRNLALIQLDGPGPFSPVPLGLQVPEPGAQVLAIVQPNALAWEPVPLTVVQRFALAQGRPDPLRFLLRAPAPMVGEGGPIVDDSGRLLGIVTEPVAGQPPTEVVAVGIDALRVFIDRAGVYAPGFALAITTQPPGAAVTVDGKPAGTTGAEPLRLEKLTMGRHEVRLSHPGDADDVVSVELVEHGVQSLNRTLDPGGALAVTANAPAEIWVDGSLRGTAPATLQLPSGTHVLDVRAAGFLPVNQQVAVVAGARKELAVSLEPITAELTLATVPPGAEVSANGAPLGTTPLAHARVPAGNVELALRLEGKHAYRFAIQLQPRESRDLGTYRLEEPFGWLDPQVPLGTQVSLDGGPRHVPQRYERLPVGEHTLSVFAPGYYAHSEKIAVADAQTVALDPPLALYDRLPTRRAVGYGMSGLGIALGLVSIGFATDKSTSNLVAPALLTGLVATGVGVFCLVSSPRAEEAGWSEERTYLPAAGAHP